MPPADIHFRQFQASFTMTSLITPPIIYLEIYYPDGRKFLTTLDNAQAQEAQRQAEAAQQQAERLAAQLSALGIEPILE
ncbi:hypothetical protein RIF25_03490 [Thermosynechococcaceae cyanobacterium BACA0444]|uniref:Uncharacterized protein n=1 Tax=Pseudocalidococcus azoricus BACA0444 TaxID=2918990 RepID=A0AAE4FPS3_9CYAN|nr:hypothetical protein [Pseudocalidococcus azoricus]MDS3859865.1 hypothetical protein [Pseudocalidococcus azoricus BACA0444]